MHAVVCWKWGGGEVLFSKGCVNGKPAKPACPVVRSHGQDIGVGYSPVFIHVPHNGKVGLELITVKRDAELLI